jgi:hypothetical protein
MGMAIAAGGLQVANRAVLDLEQQRRELTHPRTHGTGAFASVAGNSALSEELFFSNMRALDRRRNAALDVLAKHQQLEHR